MTALNYDKVDINKRNNKWKQIHENSQQNTKIKININKQIQRQSFDTG